jgi:hypothetical protein
MSRMRRLYSDLRGLLAVLLAGFGFLAACDGRDLVLGQGRLRAADGGVPSGMFAEPTAMLEVSGPHTVDDDPSLTADRTELCFNSKRTGGMGHEDIWCSRRSTTTEPWNAPVPVEVLNTEHRETGVALAPDGLVIWFSSDRPDGEGGLDIYTSTRPNRDDDWLQPRHVDELSSSDDDLVSSIGSGELAIFLARRSNDNDDYDLFTSARSDETRPWHEPELISELSSKQEESDAFLLSDNQRLIFTRDKDLYLAERSAPDAAFEVVGAIDELNSSDDDRDPWAAADFGYVVFSSDRDGSYRLYEATR